VKVTKENFEEGAYRRGIAWEVFENGDENEHHDAVAIQKVDVVEHPDTDEFFTARHPADEDDYNPWFMYDDEAWLMVLFLALDGDKDAKDALREIGCTRHDLAVL
jgi:hypothetical protein